MPHDGADAGPVWLDYARADLKLASSADASDPIVRGLCCFHCQQAAEKALKGVLVSRQVAFRKAHSLTYLVALVEDIGLEIPDELHAATRLNLYIAESRYPDELIDAAPESLVEAISLAKGVVTWAEAVLGQH